jgi:hypothetical protein
LILVHKASTGLVRLYEVVLIRLYEAVLVRLYEAVQADKPWQKHLVLEEHTAPIYTNYLHSRTVANSVHFIKSYMLHVIILSICTVQLQQHAR